MGIAWFIRHGESESNSGLRVLYPDGAGLTALGLAQAELAATWFTEAPRLFVTSPFRRTTLTAEPARRRFPATPHEVWPVQEFTTLGNFVGRHSTLEERQPLLREYWKRSDPFESEVGGESFADLLARVAATVARLRALPDDGVIAIYSHGLFMGALCWALLTGSFVATPARMAQYRNLRRAIDLPNGARLRVRLSADGATWLSGIERLPSDDPTIAGEEDGTGTLEGHEFQPRRGPRREGDTLEQRGAD